ncbi:hypothetical protein HYV64_00100 [Candidatus Shapirobacteria bacterium]|nr:hypothetical protein [Candidatus Shapirobacteria bacterium]
MSEKINLSHLDIPSTTPLVTPSLPPTKTFPRIPLAVTIPIIVLMFFATFTYAFNLGKNTNPPIVQAPTPTSYPQVSPTQYVSPPTPTGISLNLSTLNPGNITWLQFPTPASLDVYQKPDAQGYIGNSNIIYKDIKYLQVGNFSDGSKLINAMVPSEGMGIWYHVEHFVTTPQGTIYMITPGKNITSYNNPTVYLKPEVKFTDLKIPGLESPDIISTDKGDFGSTTFFMDNTISFTELKNPEQVIDTPYGRIYSVYTDSSKDLNITIDGGIYDRKFWLRLKDDTVRGYELSIKFITDDKIPKITWDDGTSNTIAFDAGFGGKCGSNFAKLFRGNTPMNSQFSKVGTNSLGEPVYAISDKSHPVYKRIYDGLDVSARPDMDTFLKRHNHFIWQEPLGDWWLFISTENIIQAECAKPVVYLYPQKDTVVNVRVGAQVTESEPLYPSNGWNVLAHPNSQLEYQGNTYPNLFWEGTGNGIYPNKDNYGFVVSQSELVSTLKSQLAQLGLNPQESADFMEFWQPKLPTSPYVRLTWLNTADMDRLAPLTVSPRPDTSIRIFLDFAPLDQPISLIPQELSSPARQGFTLVEWGGLLVK